MCKPLFFNPLGSVWLLNEIVPYTNKLHVLHAWMHDIQKGSVVVFQQFACILSTLGGAEVTLWLHHIRYMMQLGMIFCMRLGVLTAVLLKVKSSVTLCCLGCSIMLTGKQLTDVSEEHIASVFTVRQPKKVDF